MLVYQRYPEGHLQEISLKVGVFDCVLFRQLNGYGKITEKMLARKWSGWLLLKSNFLECQFFQEPHVIDPTSKLGPDGLWVWGTIRHQANSLTLHVPDAFCVSLGPPNCEAHPARVAESYLPLRSITGVYPKMDGLYGKSTEYGEFKGTPMT